MDPTLPPIDWRGHVTPVSRVGGLLPLLHELPRVRWCERDPEDGETFLHLAALGGNVAAAVALLQHGLDVNATSVEKLTPVHVAVVYGHCPAMLEVLCAAGAHLQACQSTGLSPLNLHFDWWLREVTGCPRVLVANGVRLSTVRENLRKYITPELVAFERGVLRCRAVVVALLRVKRAGRLVLWDKFLLAEMAVAVWSTRYAEH